MSFGSSTAEHGPPAFQIAYFRDLEVRATQAGPLTFQRESFRGFGGSHDPGWSARVPERAFSKGFPRFARLRLVVCPRSKARIFVIFGLLRTVKHGGAIRVLESVFSFSFDFAQPGQRALFRPFFEERTTTG